MQITIRGEEYPLEQVGSAVTIPLASILGTIAESRSQMEAIAASDVNENAIVESVIKALQDPTVHGKIAFSISRMVPTLAEKHPKLVSWVSDTRWSMNLEVEEILTVMAAAKPKGQGTESNETQLEIELPKAEEKSEPEPEPEVEPEAEKYSPGFNQAQSDIKSRRRAELLAELALLGD